MKYIAATLLMSGLLSVGVGLFNKSRRIYWFTAGGLIFLMGWTLVELFITT